MNKICNNKGSTFTIAIVVMALFIIVIFMLSFQVNTQIKSNTKQYEQLQQKYLAESGIDKTIADIIYELENELEDNLKNINQKYPQRNSIDTKYNVNDEEKYFQEAIQDIENAKKYTGSCNENDNDKARKRLIDIENKLREIENYSNWDSKLTETFNQIQNLKNIEKEVVGTSIFNITEYRKNVLSAMENLYNARNVMYNSENSHVNHSMVEIEHNKIRDICNNIVASKITNNGLLSVYQELGNLNSGNGDSKLENTLYAEVENLSKNISSNLGQNGDSSLLTSLANDIQNNNIKDRNDEAYQSKVKEIGNYIDDCINKIIKIQIDLDKLHSEKGKDDYQLLKNRILEVQNKIEDVKYYLIEVKCKLGIISNNHVISDNENNDIKINLKIPSYKFPNEEIYKSNGYERYPINMSINIDTNSSTTSFKINDIESIGYKNNDEYKINASVKFNIGKQNGIYKVISYEICDWKMRN